MRYPPDAAQAILRMVNECMQSDDPPELKIRKVWWTLLYTRGRKLTKDLRDLVGDKIIGGPFKGMTLTNEALALYQSPMLLGCYEHELHPVSEKIIAGNYTHILNIGCSVGYYAVGLARRMPRVIVEAFDIDPEARRKCAAMAKINGVEDRIRISGEFRGEDFAAYADKKVLILMDIESAETTLLDPEKYPALRKMDIVVELHDLMDPTISKTVCDRFTPSHAVELIRNRNHLPDLNAFSSPGNDIGPFDHLLLGWEGRDGQTPWGVFIANS